MHSPASRSSLLGLLVLLNGAAAAGHAEELYFVVVFGAQRVPNIPKYSHSFATFIQAAGSGPSPENYALESHTISWLPDTLDIRVLRLVPEPGRNLDLRTTLQVVRSMGERVSMWGPYQIRRELYERALEQIAFLESEAIQYKACDALHHTSRASNCVHALSNVAEGQRRLRITRYSFGEIASSNIVRRYDPWIIEPEQVHDWVALRLGVAPETVIPRAFSDKPRAFPHRCFPPASR
jgi:hypothetical protein